MQSAQRCVSCRCLYGKCGLNEKNNEIFWVSPETTIYEAMKKNGTFLGILSTRDVIKACIQEKDQDMKALNNIASWNYYDDWKWKPK